jgi:iron complex outermembrane receptor protein
MKSKLACFTALTGAGVVFAAFGAHAQATGPTSAAANASQESVSTVGEVIVTAQRRAERLEDVPISVTALSGTDLAKAGVTNLRDLQTVAPSFQVSSSGVFTQLSIRGITSTALGPGIENNIAVYVDGIYEPDSSALGSDFANVSDVQILKGPQGTLYGRNATGGAMLVNTREPSDSREIYDISAGYGRYNDRRVQAYFGIPIHEGLSLGIGVYHRANDGYIKNVNGSEGAPFKDTEIRTKLKWEPSDSFSAVLGFNYFHKSDPLVLAFTVTSLSPYGLPNGPVYTNQLDRISLDPNPVFTDLMKETTLRLKWVTGAGSFTSHTAYTDEKPHFDNDYDGTTLPGQQIPATFLRHTFYQALDYEVKPIETVEVQAGASYFKDQSSNNAVAFLGPAALPSVPVLTDIQQTNVAMLTKAYAGYVDVTWQAVPKLFLNAGVRYSHDKRTVFGYYISNLFVPPPFPLYPPRTSASFHAVTPRATIRYEFAPRSNVYLSYSKGFKSGTFNTVGTTPQTLSTPVQPEHVSAYEVGLKTAQGPWRLEAASYYYDYKNLQVNALSTDPATLRILNTLTNAASAKIYGAEVSGAWAVTPDLNLRASLAYTHARYRKFPNGSASLPTPTINPVGVVTGVQQDFSGLRIARAPDWTANVGGDYTIPLGVGKLLIAANGYYTSKYAPLAIDYNPITKEPYYYDKGYFLANASLDYMWDHFSVGAYVNNIGNKRFYILNQADGFGVKKVLSWPRTYGVRVSYSY